MSKQAGGGVGGAERARDPAIASGAAGGVVGERVRQDDGVGLGVRQVEGAAEHMAELVVQRHRRAPSTVPQSQAP